MPAFRPSVDLSSFTLPEDAHLAAILMEAIIDPVLPEAEPLEQPNIALALSMRSYTISRNETLDAISRRFGISLETLISVNGINDVRRIQANTVLKIPNIDGVVHTVKRGDSLSAIAVAHKSTVLDLIDTNDLASQVITPGQTLFVPGGRMSAYDLKKALGTLVIWPLNGRISSYFGYRANPFTGVRQFHSGLDIVGAMNQPIKAAMDGRVAETGYSAIYGNFVIMTHAGSYQTLYAHLNQIRVKPGQTLAQGAVVGLVGSTGYSTGPHLHFGVFKNGTPMDPLKFLQGT